MIIKRFVIFGTVLVLLTVSCSPEDDQSKADSAPAEVQRLEQWASTGNTEAAYKLGLLYAEKQDYQKAIEWMTTAAEGGHLRGQYNLGLMYQEGLGTKQDFKKAVEWYTAAAMQGLREAQISLGWMIQAGLGVEKDEADARRWYLWAGENPLDWSPYARGIFYARGSDQAPDMKQAYIQLELAEAYGFDTAVLRQQVRRNLTEDEFEEAQLIAQGQLKTKDPVLFYTRAAQTGDSDAMYELGVLYEKGWWVRKDYNAAFHWFARLAEQGERRGQYKLGLFYELGYGRDKDDKLAVRWYLKSADQGYPHARKKLAELQSRQQESAADHSERLDRGLEISVQGNRAEISLAPMPKEIVEECLRAAEAGDREAQYKLGFMYSFGRGVDLNGKEAVRWYTKAADQGKVEALLRIGDMYRDGFGVQVDYGEAFQWYQKGAELGNRDCQFYIAGMYFRGRGVEQDYEKAFAWYLKAAEQGSAGAQMKLAEMCFYEEGTKGDLVESWKWLLLAENGQPGNSEIRNILKTELTADQKEEGERRADAFGESHAEKEN